MPPNSLLLMHLLMSQIAMMMLRVQDPKMADRGEEETAAIKELR